MSLHSKTDEEWVRRMLLKRLSPSGLLNKLLLPMRSHPGKLLRSRLFFAAMSTEEASTAALKIALGLELLHLASLIHDDLIDETILRRGGDSLWQCRGGPAALLCGDYLFAEAFCEMYHSGIAQATPLMRRLVLGMVKAELEQQYHAFHWDLPIHQYLRRVRLKTARFFGLSAFLGSLAAHRSSMQNRKCYRLGLALGMAYQLVDDLEDITDEGDLKQGIYSLPLLELAKRDASGEKILKRISKDRHIKAGDSKRLRERLAATNGYLSTVGQIKGYINQAEAIILAMPKTEGAILLNYLQQFRAYLSPKEVLKNRQVMKKTHADLGIIH